MCAVETADPEMHYADVDLVAVIGGLGDGDIRQRCLRELHDSVTTELTVPGTRSESRRSAAFFNGKRAFVVAWGSTRRGSSGNPARVGSETESVVYVTVNMLAS
jgi:hypothetical protein